MNNDKITPAQKRPSDTALVFDLLQLLQNRSARLHDCSNNLSALMRPDLQPKAKPSSNFCTADMSPLFGEITGRLQDVLQELDATIEMLERVEC